MRLTEVPVIHIIIIIILLHAHIGTHREAVKEDENMNDGNDDDQERVMYTIREHAVISQSCTHYCTQCTPTKT